MSGQRSVRLLKSHFVEQGFRQSFILLEELTDEIHRAEKQAYEKVIRIMSHEVNNSVGAINSILDSALEYGQQLQDEDREDFSTALQVAIDRNSRLNQFMANFADVVRTPLPQKSIVDLQALIQQVLLLMSSACRERRIALESRLPDTPLLVNIDQQQFEQVLLNILKNALEACKEDDRIEIAVSDSGGHIVLSIQNNGIPIPAETKAHLFTPFYSSKTEGQGIGLTLTKEILRNHGCRFSLNSDERGITTFMIILRAG